MAIRVRRGNFADFDPSKMLVGEFAFALDHGVPTGEIYFCVSPGNVRKLATIEELQALLQASGTAYTALQQLITDLNGSPNELANILANISTLKDDVTIIKNGKFDKANIIQTTAVNDTNKVPSSAVTYSLANQLSALNDNLANLNKGNFNGNLNTLLTPLQTCYFGATATNTPVAGSSGYLIVFGYNNGTTVRVVQFAIVASTIYVRDLASNNGGTSFTNTPTWVSK